MKIIVLCGGRGIRLWPLSNERTPKQFIAIYNKFSFLQKTLLRFYPENRPDDFLIITSLEHLDLAKRQALQINPQFSERVIAEPYSKNTCFALFFALEHLRGLKELSDEELILVVPCDQYIEPKEKLLEAIKDSLPFAEKGSHVVFGISPTYPENGYGYILAKKSRFSCLLKVEKFIEKPTLDLAKLFFLSGSYLWNSGMFLFKAESIACDLKKWYIPQSGDYADCRAESIDKAIMEKSNNIYVCPLNIEWSDIGDWIRLYQHLPKDEKGNASSGEICQMHSSNNLFIAKEKPIIALGVEGMIIVETDQAIFIAKQSEIGKLSELKELMLKRC